MEKFVMTNLNPYLRADARTLSGLVQLWADRLVSRWLKRSTARHVWRHHVPVLNST
jgi:hypothetical protein